MARPIFAVLATFLPLALASALRAQEPEPPVPATRATDVRAATVTATDRPARVSIARAGTRARAEPFVLAAGRHELGPLVDRAAQWLGRNYLKSEVEFGTPNLVVDLQTEMRLDAASLEVALNHFLHTHGFAVIVLSADLQLYSVVSMSGPRRGEIATHARSMSPDDVLANAERIETVATVVPLAHINAMMAANALRPFFAQSQNSLVVGNFGDENAIALLGFAPQVAAAIRLIRTADETSGRAQTRDALQRLEERLGELERANPKPRS